MHQTPEFQPPSPEQLLTLLGHSPRPKQLLSPAREQLWANQAWQRLTSYTPTPGPHEQRVHPDDAAQLEHLYSQLLAGTLKHFCTPLRYRHAEGGWLWLTSTVSTLYDEQGSLTGLLEELQESDPPPRQQASERQLEERLAELEALAHLGFWQASLDGPLSLSSGCYRILGRDPESFSPDIAGLTSVLHPDDLERTRAALQQALTGQTEVRLPFRIIRPDGEARHLLGLFRLEGQSLKGYCLDQTIETEQSELLKATQQLLATQKSRLLELAGSVSTSLEGPLAYLDALDLLAANRPAPAPELSDKKLEFEKDDTA